MCQQKIKNRPKQLLFAPVTSSGEGLSSGKAMHAVQDPMSDGWLFLAVGRTVVVHSTPPIHLSAMA